MALNLVEIAAVGQEPAEDNAATISPVNSAAPAKILIAEDDRAIAAAISDMLRDSGYDCRLAHDGLDALQLALSEDFDLIVLDVGLPSISGLDVCREVKAKRPQTAIMMLTARTDEIDVVSGLEVGADDYVCKPFKPRELVARVRARLREQTQRRLYSATHKSDDAATPPEELTIGEMHIDFVRMTVTMAGEKLDLSAREYAFIEYLASSPGRPFNRDELLESVWGVTNPSYAPNVSVFMSRLRRKIEKDPLNPKYILTVRGVGYRLAEPHEF